MKFLKDKEYDRFPEDMREAAREAYETFLHTRDGQLADIIVDRAALDAIRAAGGEIERRDRPAVCGIYSCGSRYPDRSPCLQNRKKVRTS